MYDNYSPAPIDTSDVVLTEDILLLINKLARNQHELRSKAYADAGWVFGDRLDSYKHTNPGLIPYSQLTEDQKQIDINTVSDIVKTILALGYSITI